MEDYSKEILRDGLRFLPVENTTAGQVPEIVIPFLKIIKDFDLIIEIGVYWGGLTLWFHRNKNPTARAIGYDVTDAHIEVTDPAVEFRIANCFDGNIIEEIKTLIETRGKTLIFCDGGNKNMEFHTYAQYLKSGDVIMTHDYLDDRKPEPYKSFPEARGWSSGPESFYRDMKGAIETCSLEEHPLYEDFRRCLIGAFVKV